MEEALKKHLKKSLFMEERSGSVIRDMLARHWNELDTYANWMKRISCLYLNLLRKIMLKLIISFRYSFKINIRIA